MAQVLAVNFRNRQSVPPKMAREFQKGNILFVNVVENANGAQAFFTSLRRESHDLAARGAQLPLQGLHARGGHTKMLLK